MVQRRILLVEDETLIRTILSENLSEAGYEVVEASDGDHAVRLLARLDRLDLLFTDIQMPGDTCGNTLAAMAKAQHPGLPVIYTTGRPDTLTNELGSMDALMRKPFGPAEVLAAVSRLLGHGAGSEYVSGSAPSSRPVASAASYK